MRGAHALVLLVLACVATGVPLASTPDLEETSKPDTSCEGKIASADEAIRLCEQKLRAPGGVSEAAPHKPNNQQLYSVVEKQNERERAEAEMRVALAHLREVERGCLRVAVCNNTELVEAGAEADAASKVQSNAGNVLANAVAEQTTIVNQKKSALNDASIKLSNDINALNDATNALGAIVTNLNNKQGDFDRLNASCTRNPHPQDCQQQLDALCKEINDLKNNRDRQSDVVDRLNMDIFDDHGVCDVANASYTAAVAHKNDVINPLQAALEDADDRLKKAQLHLCEVRKSCNITSTCPVMSDSACAQRLAAAQSRFIISGSTLADASAQHSAAMAGLYNSEAVKLETELQWIYAFNASVVQLWNDVRTLRLAETEKENAEAELSKIEELCKTDPPPDCASKYQAAQQQLADATQQFNSAQVAVGLDRSRANYASAQVAIAASAFQVAREFYDDNDKCLEQAVNDAMLNYNLAAAELSKTEKDCNV